ncbi:unnamed protein product [Heligmosomoides polygyrus]|uniref:SH3 domain-containing protein n=1 Tax=Heligmosomoides polygyrus TaxID=6339 RepID=A0A183FEU2_HELPZ|nr:unnamed protein product [Heligmosomoides polygyrus]
MAKISPGEKLVSARWQVIELTANPGWVRGVTGKAILVLTESADFDSRYRRRNASKREETSPAAGEFTHLADDDGGVATCRCPQVGAQCRPARTVPPASVCVYSSH